MTGDTKNPINLDIWLDKIYCNIRSSKFDSNKYFRVVNRYLIKNSTKKYIYYFNDKIDNYLSTTKCAG